MKKFLSFIFIIFLSNSAFAEYEVYINKSQPFSVSQISKKEVIFFGKLEQYQKNLHEINKAIIANGALGALNGLSSQASNLAKGLLNEGLKAGASGMGFGLVMGALNTYVDSLYADQLYIKVYKIKLSNNKTVFMNKFFVGNKYPELSKNEINNILGDQ